MLWTDNEIIKRAKCEPTRFEWWKRYYPEDELEAARHVVENPPVFDNYWEQVFPLKDWLGGKFKEDDLIL